MAKILVADDEELIRKLIGDALTKDGHTVLQAEDGLEAVAVYKKNTDISLVILDIMMPRLDGIHATLKIRENSSIPIIILSAKSEIDDKVLGLDSGANYYLTKPFDTKELLAAVILNAVNKWLNSRGTAVKYGWLLRSRLWMSEYMKSNCGVV